MLNHYNIPFKGVIKLKLRLEDLKSGLNEFWASYTDEDLDLKNQDFELVNKLDLYIRAVKRGRNVELTLEATYTLRLTCARCLDEFNKKFNEKETYYIKIGKEPFFEEKSLKERDIFTQFIETDEIDVVPFVREMVILSVPMKPLCKPDCKGLCPVCGVNWNYETCEHMNQPKVDTRMAKLLELKSKLGM